MRVFVCVCVCVCVFVCMCVCVCVCVNVQVTLKCRHSSKCASTSFRLLTIRCMAENYASDPDISIDFVAYKILTSAAIMLIILLACMWYCFIFTIPTYHEVITSLCDSIHSGPNARTYNVHPPLPQNPPSYQTCLCVCVCVCVCVCIHKHTFKWQDSAVNLAAGQCCHPSLTSCC